MSLSIVTAVDPERDDFLSNAAASVQALRKHLEIQWVLIWDGPPARHIAEADLVISGRRHGGISCTRNLALSALTSPLVTILDADNLIVVDGALAGCRELQDNPHLGWVGLSRTLIDGSREAFVF